MIVARFIAAPLWLVYILAGLTVLAITTGIDWVAHGGTPMVYASWPDW